jgi:glycerophosphoryl diester phosphodiesterase
MHDDEASTGVAYDIHDAPTLDRTTDEDYPARDRDRQPNATPPARRFGRLTAPVEPMS